MGVRSETRVEDKVERNEINIKPSEMVCNVSISKKKKKSRSFYK